MGDGDWTQVWVKAGTEVWRVETGVMNHYVKIGPPADIAAEAEAMAWLTPRSPVAVPDVQAHAPDHAGRGWLVTAGLAGVPAHSPELRMGSVEGLVEALGRGLRRFHDGLDPNSCPVDRRVAVLVPSARRRLARGGIDPATMSPTYRRRTPEQLLDLLENTRPEDPAADVVVAPGAPCLPNLLCDPATATLIGLVDLGRVGVSDRYRDLAIASRTLVENLGPEVVWRFFAAYGLADPDPARLEWYVLVDDLW
ncbi:MAG: aminoglycoside 3'-phosphotransferase [Acidimicrobiales bacterium]